MALIRAVQDDQTGGVTYCTRGLERYFTVDTVQDKRNDAWDSVLDEQDMQRDHGSFDSDRMSKAYSKCTRRSSMEAAERGKLDEDAIARYLKKTRQMVRRSCSLPANLTTLKQDRHGFPILLPSSSSSSQPQKAKRNSNNNRNSKFATTAVLPKKKL